MLQLQRLQNTIRSSNRLRRPTRYRMGQRVMAHRSIASEWVPATVVRNSSTALDLEFDDGDRQTISVSNIVPEEEFHKIVKAETESYDTGQSKSTIDSDLPGSYSNLDERPTFSDLPSQVTQSQKSRIDSGVSAPSGNLEKRSTRLILPSQKTQSRKSTIDSNVSAQSGNLEKRSTRIFLPSRETQSQKSTIDSDVSAKSGNLEERSARIRLPSQETQSQKSTIDSDMSEPYGNLDEGPIGIVQPSHESQSHSQKISSSHSRPSRSHSESDLKLSDLIGTRRSDLNSSQEKMSETKTRVKLPFTYRLILTIWTLFLIVLVVGVNLNANWMSIKYGCSSYQLPDLSSLCLHDFIDPFAFGLYVGWFAFQAILYSLPIGKVAQIELANGSLVKHRINGFYALVISLVVLFASLYKYNVIDQISQKIFPLLITSIGLAFFIALVLHLESPRVESSDSRLSHYGNTGCILYDFFLGPSLHFSFLGEHLKMFIKFRPGLIGWVVINVICLLKDFKDKGCFSVPLMVSVACQVVFVSNELYNEESRLAATDISTEGLGFWFVYYHISFMPFFFTIQSRCLLYCRKKWTASYIAAFIALYLIGLYIYRESNNQRDALRHDRTYKFSKSKSISIGRLYPKKRLLIEGWWATVRHPNYIGDLMMGLAWCLPTGFGHILPYSYFIFRLIFLVHRSLRMDEMCRQKYGVAWTKYCARVPKRILPHVF